MVLTFTTIFVFYVAVFLAVIGTVWIIAIWKGRHHARGRGEPIVCPYCDHGFEVDPMARSVRCPRCHGRIRRAEWASRGGRLPS